MIDQRWKKRRAGDSHSHVLRHCGDTRQRHALLPGYSMSCTTSSASTAGHSTPRTCLPANWMESVRLSLSLPPFAAVRIPSHRRLAIYPREQTLRVSEVDCDVLRPLYSCFSWRSLRTRPDRRTDRQRTFKEGFEALGSIRQRHQVCTTTQIQRHRTA